MVGQTWINDGFDEAATISIISQVGLQGVFNPDQPGFRFPDSVCNRTRVSAIEQIQPQAPVFAEFDQPVTHAPIDNPGCDDVITRPQ